MTALGILDRILDNLVHRKRLLQPQHGVQVGLGLGMFRDKKSAAVLIGKDRGREGADALGHLDNLFFAMTDQRPQYGHT